MFLSFRNFTENACSIFPKIVRSTRGISTTFDFCLLEFLLRELKTEIFGNEGENNGVKIRHCFDDIDLDFLLFVSHVSLFRLHLSEETTNNA
jgi:hypothetical protein